MASVSNAASLAVDPVSEKRLVRLPSQWQAALRRKLEHGQLAPAFRENPRARVESIMGRDNEKNSMQRLDSHGEVGL